MTEGRGWVGQGENPTANQGGTPERIPETRETWRVPATALCPAVPPRFSPSSAFRGVRSSLKSSQRGVHKRGGRGAPRAGLVTRFPPL